MTGLLQDVRYARRQLHKSPTREHHYFLSSVGSKNGWIVSETQKDQEAQSEHNAAAYFIRLPYGQLFMMSPYGHGAVTD